jgi:hypothetical protein
MLILRHVCNLAIFIWCTTCLESRPRDAQHPKSYYDAINGRKNVLPVEQRRRRWVRFRKEIEAHRDLIPGASWMKLVPAIRNTDICGDGHISAVPVRASIGPGNGRSSNESAFPANLRHNWRTYQACSLRVRFHRAFWLFLVDFD